MTWFSGSLVSEKIGISIARSMASVESRRLKMGGPPLQPGVVTKGKFEQSPYVDFSGILDEYQTDQFKVFATLM